MSGSSEYFYDPIQPEFLYLHRVTTYKLETIYHRHNAYEIYLFLRGNVHFYVENRCYHVQPGDLLVMSPAEMHRAFILDESEYERITINLKKTYLHQLSTASTNLKQILQWTSELEGLLASDTYGADIKINAVIAQLLVMVNVWFHNNSFIPHDIMPDLVRETMNYIETHLNEDITLRKLAEAFYMNSTYISRQFKMHTGLTIRSYILGRRIERAKFHLSEGMSITDACFQSGFSDYANFIRSFTKMVGISPGKYSKQHRDANEPLSR
jgi:AraC-like DNA-binding protein